MKEGFRDEIDRTLGRMGFGVRVQFLRGAVMERLQCEEILVA